MFCFCDCLFFFFFKQKTAYEMRISDWSSDVCSSDLAPFALLGLAVMVTLMVSGLVPNVLAALIGCLVMGLFRCIDMDSAYKAIHWQSLVLIVGMLPFALALQKTGGIALATSGLVGLLGDAGDW